MLETVLHVVGHVGTDVDWGAAWSDVRRILVEQFAVVHSLALQQTLWSMGSAVLEAHPEVARISLSARTPETAGGAKRTMPQWQGSPHRRFGCSLSLY